MIEVILRTRSLLPAALVLAVLAILTVPAEAMRIKEVTSPKGIKGWLIQDATVPLFTMQFAFRGGSALDPVGKEGLGEMVSGLLDEGAGPLDSRAFQGKLENNSIAMRFSSGADSFGGSIRALTEYGGLATDLLRLALSRPRFDAEPVERMRSQYLSQVRRRVERPGYTARRAWKKAVFSGHPYGREMEGTEASLKAISAADLKGFVKTRFARDNLIIGAVGDLDEETFGKMMDHAFGSLPARAAPVVVPEARISGAGKVIVTDRDIPQSIAVFGHKGIKRKHPDFYAAYLITYVLGGGGLTSRLATEIREKRGLAYSVYVRLVTMDHAGLISGRVATANARVKESLALIRKEWARVAKEGITAKELEDAKRYLTGSFYTRLNSTRRIARLLVGIQLEKMGLDYLDRRNAMIAAVTMKDVRRVARQLFHPDDLTISIVGRPKGVIPRP
ncbi:MAG: pitrilysin family protein [Alphaproteobacteria bacterium]|nr:pitrilysin family protein [Alphaproteobacteria bacterium]